MLFATQRSSGYTNSGKKYLLKSTFKKPFILKLTFFFPSFTLHVRVSQNGGVSGLLWGAATSRGLWAAA